MKELLKQSNHDFLNQHENHLRKVQRDLYRTIQKPNSPQENSQHSTLNFLNELLKV